jgi:tetratricopeptide (TPR) repeat protein
MAHANVFLGFLDDGLMNLSEALKHLAPSGQTDQLAYNHLVEGSIAATRGDYKHSDDAYGKAIELYRVARMPHEVAWVRCCLAETQWLRGQYWKAALNLEEASDFLESRTDQLARARVEVYEAALAVSLGALEDAERALARAESRLNGSGYWEASLRMLHVQGALSLALSRFQAAVEELDFAMRASAQSRFKELELLAQAMLGQALTHIGEFGEARTTLLAALATSKRLGFRGVETVAGLATAQLFYQSDDLESAVRTGGEAVALAKSLSIGPVVFRGSVVLGDALFKLGRSQKAAAAYREAHGAHQLLLAGVAPSLRQTYIASPEINACLDRITDRLV